MFVSEGERVNGDVDQISLVGLIEGTYNICVMAHTVAGGAAGPWQMVAVGENDITSPECLICVPSVCSGGAGVCRTPCKRSIK